MSDFSSNHDFTILLYVSTKENHNLRSQRSLWWYLHRQKRPNTTNSISHRWWVALFACMGQTQLEGSGSGFLLLAIKLQHEDKISPQIVNTCVAQHPRAHSAVLHATARVTLTLMRQREKVKRRACTRQTHTHTHTGTHTHSGATL